MTILKRLSCLATLTLIGVLASTASAQLKIDFTRAPDDEPLQDGWTPYQADDVFAEESFDLDGTSIDVTVEGNTHWRDYREATRGFGPLSDLLRDGVLCNAVCDMTLTLGNLPDGDYDLRAYLHTTQFGQEDGRPFSPFDISLSDGKVQNELVVGDVLASDNSSDDLSSELISLSVVGGSPVEIVFSKFEGTDHLQLDGFELGPAGTLGDPPVIKHPDPPDSIVIDFPDGLKVDFSRDPDEFPLQDDWEPFVGEGIDVITESFDFEGGSVDITIEGNTHWRDYRAANPPFDNYSDLLSDGPLCNDFCAMTLTLEDLADGDYELIALFHTTQFGPQDGRPFSPFEIRLTDSNVTDEVLNDEALMSDDSSEELSLEIIPFTISGGSEAQIVFEKFGGDDHFALPGFVLSKAGGLRGDFNQNEVLDADDMDLLSKEVRDGTHRAPLDLNGDSKVDEADRVVWVKEVRRTWFGDANLDGEFESGDLVGVFTAGKYEKEVEAGWAEGDWNGDGEFTSGDFVDAFRDGGYEQGLLPAMKAVPEPTSVSMLLIGLLSVSAFRQRRRNLHVTANTHQ